MSSKKLHRISPKYSTRHFDGVISNYRECLNSDLSFVNLPALKRIRKIVRDALGRELTFQTPHILELKDSSSFILPHVDHKEASGKVIATLSLLSSCVIIFKRLDGLHEFQITIPQNSLYVQFDSLRYDYTHELPAGSGRRIAIIQRDIPIRGIEASN